MSSPINSFVLEVNKVLSQLRVRSDAVENMNWLIIDADSARFLALQHLSSP